MLPTKAIALVDQQRSDFVLEELKFPGGRRCRFVSSREGNAAKVGEEGYGAQLAQRNRMILRRTL